MKSCAYCGRESVDEMTHCRECGTEFVTEPIGTKSPQPRDWAWIKTACGYAGAVSLIVFAYLLSFGPVMRYSATVISQSSITNATGFTTQRTVQYPRWVEVLYYPAFSMIDGVGDGGLAVPYWRYLQLWEIPQTQK